MKDLLFFSLLILFGVSHSAKMTANDYLHIDREGVKWVNERVIVNHGDTTNYYYNYEICGNDSLDFDLLGYPYKACYYYTGNRLDINQDSLIAGLRCRYQGRYSCYRNNPYFKNLSEGKALFRLSFVFSENYTIEPNLYWFQCTPDYYLLCQEYFPESDEQVLTSENFTEVDPVQIEEVMCRRWAYVKENGDTMCYVVEGIGFDSRDMGDLLTPFTREPDHDADYQEWCGLSHVVKDGQIIYKGMRYRHGAFTGIDEVVADRTRRPADPNYYNLMGQPVSQDVPTAPGIYIHQGKKVVVR